MARRIAAHASLLLLLLSGSGAGAQQVTGQDVDKILERADKILDEAKAAYEEARTRSSVSGFVDAGFKLEEARIKYLVLQEIGSPEKQKIAADRMRAVNQLGKLIHDGKVAISGAPADLPPPRPVDAPAPGTTPTPKPPPATVQVVADVSARKPVPDPAKQRETEKLIREVYGDKYARKATADRVALAHTLLEEAARSADDQVARWVMYREAQDLAAQAGDVRTAIEAVDAMAAVFDVDALPLQSAAVAAASKAAKTPGEFSALTAVSLRLVEAFIAIDQYDAADKAANAALQYARRSNEPALIARCTTRTKDVAEARAKFGSLKTILETLAKNPDDGPANLEMGQFLCFIKGSWDLGLRFLVKGSDPALKAIAEKELAQPPDSLAAGDAWWELGEKEKNPGRKERLQARAVLHYAIALPQSTGLTRAKLDRRLAESGRADEPSAAGLVGRWLFNEGTGTSAADTSGKNNHGTLQNRVAWTTGMSGSAVQFDGSGYVSCGIDGMPAGNAEQTIAWSYLVAQNPAGGGIGQALIVLSDPSATFSLSPGFCKGKLAVWKWAEGILVSTTAPTAGEWHACAYTYDKTTHRLYVDGVLRDASTVPPQTATPRRLELARWGGDFSGAGAGGYFTGRLDEVRIYTRALSESEIKLLAKVRK
jgi:hypothetical protein